MERIVYRKTLDVHKNGIQFMLQGFETADILSRVIEISLMASGDALDFPLEDTVALMYVTTPSATEPSINSCVIKDNKVVYDVLPITEEGITTMQLKIIEGTPEGASSVIASPKFSVEVTKSNADDSSVEQATTFTALEDAVAKAKTVYDKRFERMELDSECVFRAYYADGTLYETDILRKLFLNGNVELSKSYAMGGTGVRIGEDTDNSKYYASVAGSEALNAKNIMENSEEILEEVRLHGVYTAFSVDFANGEVEYVSPSFKFSIDNETGEMNAIGQSYTFQEEIERLVEDWLANNGASINDLQAISTTHSHSINNLTEASTNHQIRIEELESETRPIHLGGTGATTAKGAIKSLGIDSYQKPWNIDDNVGAIHIDTGHQVINEFVSGTAIKEFESESFTFINSGTVALSIGVRVGNYDSISEGKVTVCLNGKNEHEIYIGSMPNDFRKTINQTLSVAKGDKCTIKFSGRGDDDDTYQPIIEVYVTLMANIDTPYKYLNLF